MKITILAVGKIKEKYWNMAIQEYIKRLSRYCKLTIIEVADEKTPDGAGWALENQIKEKEGMRILSKIPSDAYVIALAIEGNMPDSIQLSKKNGTACSERSLSYCICNWRISRVIRICFGACRGMAEFFQDDISTSNDEGNLTRADLSKLSYYES